MDTTPVPAFGDLLRRYRRAAGLTQEALAERAQVSARAVSDLERGISHAPRRDTLPLLVAALQLAGEDRAAFLHAARSRSPRAAPVRSHASSLPAPLTPFIGRTQEVAAVRRLLAHDGVRLVTLIGAPGIGKTRLSLQVADELRDDFADGVWFVSLAALVDPALVLSTVARALGVEERGEDFLLERLQRALRAKHLLLVLDNFEQVLEAAPLIAELLQAAPQLHVLVTSRAVLHLTGEHAFPVPPLDVPPLQPLPTLERLTQYAAVRFFLDRVQAVRPDFELMQANAQTVAEICVRLDGLPLAIELAAARSTLLAPEALLGRLNSGLRLLTGGPRDLPARQQTIRATIDWSYGLLEAGEQHLFARLAVFVGGWTLSAAEAVGNADGSLGRDVLDLLQSLVDKSLVRVLPGAGGEQRSTMLEMLREYALEQLARSGDMPALQHRHAQYYCALAEQTAPLLDDPQAPLCLQRLEDEHDNLRAALAWSQSAWGDAAVGLRIAAALDTFWRLRYYIVEARAWHDRILAHPGDPTPARARVLVAAGSAAAIQGDTARADAFFAEGRALYQDLGDQASLAYALVTEGFARRRQGHYEDARELEETALTLARAVGHHQWAGWSLLGLSDLALDQGQVDEVPGLLQEALVRFRTQGDGWGIGWTLCQMGNVARLEGNQRRAITLFQESREQLVRSVHRQEHEELKFCLGRALQASGDAAGALRLYRESLTGFQEGGMRHSVGLVLTAIASIVASGARHPDRACRVVRLLGAANALWESVGMPLPPIERAGYEAALAAARDELGAAACNAAWVEGRAMTPEQAITYALEEVS